MDVSPRTKSGSPCKLCKAKKSACHLHGGTPRKDSKKWRKLYLKAEKEFQQEWRSQQPDKSQWYTPLTKDIPFMSFDEYLKQIETFPSPPKSPPLTQGINNWDELLGTFHDPMSTQLDLPTDFEDFKKLPKPALFKVMLNLHPQQLRILCSMSKKSNSICKEPRFRKHYIKKHSLISGKLEEISTEYIETFHYLPYNFGYHGLTVLGMKDEKGNRIFVWYDRNYNVTTITYIPREQYYFLDLSELDPKTLNLLSFDPYFISLDAYDIDNISFGFYRGQNAESVIRDTFESYIMDDDRYLFLQSIGKLSWAIIDKSEWGVLDGTAITFRADGVIDFLNIIKNAVKKIEPKLSFEMMEEYIN